MMLPPRASRLAWWSSACNPPPFSSKHKVGHYGETVLFLFHQTRGHFSKKYDHSPPCAVANRSLAFLWWFWSSVFFLADQPFRLCRYRTRFTVEIDTFVPVSSRIFIKVLCCCSGIDLHFSHQSTFISRRQNA